MRRGPAPGVALQRRSRGAGGDSRKQTPTTHPTRFGNYLTTISPCGGVDRPSARGRKRLSMLNTATGPTQTAADNSPHLYIMTTTRSARGGRPARGPEAISTARSTVLSIMTDWRAKGRADAEQLTGKARSACVRLAWDLHCRQSRIADARVEIRGLERAQLIARCEYEAVAGTAANEPQQLALPLAPMARAPLPLSRPRRNRGAA